jgi:ABC-2 type transport system permease protein
MWALLGGELDLANPYSLTNAYFYSFMWLYLGIYIIYITSNLIHQEVENHTIDLTLSKPITRIKYLLGKTLFVYIFIAALVAITTIFVALAMTSIPVFLEYGLYWDRILVVFLMVTLHLGTMAMTAVFFSTILLDTKKTTAAVIVMFIMFFIGNFSSLMIPSLGEVVQYASMWFYYIPAQFFGAGNYATLPLNILILAAINLALITTSLIIFRKKHPRLISVGFMLSECPQ